MGEERLSQIVETVSQFPQIEAYLHYSQAVWNLHRVRMQQEMSLPRRVLHVRTELELVYRADVEIPEALAALRKGNSKLAVSLVEDEAESLYRSFQTRTINARELPMSRTKAWKVCQALREVGVEKGEEMEEKFRDVGVNFRSSL